MDLWGFLKPDKYKVFYTVVSPLFNYIFTNTGYYWSYLMFLSFTAGFFGLVLFLLSYIVYNYLISCLTVFLLRKFLKKHFLLAYAFLALISVFLIISSILWSFFFTLPVTRPSGFEVTDSFCTNSNTSNILIRNSGTKSFDPNEEITVVNATTGEVLTVEWLEAQSTAPFEGELQPGQTARIKAPCATGILCPYRVLGKTTGRSLRALVQC